MTHFDETKEAIAQMGQRLRQKRLQRNESQHEFAARIGVSHRTLQRMEHGDETIQLKHWAAALEILDRTSDLDQLLKEEEDLFAKYEQGKSGRQRAGRAKRKDS
jgi:transcriptional regulator with XRE-family HTH domain